MIEERAYAKINLALDVVKKRDDGYHELQMVIIPIDLFDTLTFQTSDQITLDADVEIEDNLILKTAELMRVKFNVDKGAKIKLQKRIPIGAGLGGGSADVAATLRGLNQLWNLNLELEDLETLALELGSDTLFCLYNKPALVYGRGENLLYIEMPEIEDIYLIISEINVSTANVFKHHKIKYRSKQFDKLFRNYLNQKYQAFFNKTYNKLTPTALKCYPALKRVYKGAKRVDSHAMMSGSGSTFFILANKQNRSNLEDKFVKYGIQYLKTKPKT